MNKYFNTLTNARGDSLPNYRVQVVNSAGAAVSIYADSSGTLFTDDAGNAVNYATASTTGKVEFYWTAATGQVLQVLDVSGNLVDATADFANNFTLSGLPGEIAQSAVTNLVTDLAAKAVTADLAASTGAALVGALQTGTGAVARTVQAKLRDTLSVFDFIPVAEHAAIQDGTTTTDVTAYITLALTYAQTTAFQEKTLVFPAGTYRVSQINLRDCSYLTLHADGTVNITGIDGTQGWIIGDDRFDDLGHTENFTTRFSMTGGPWLITPLAGQTYARGLKLQNFVDCTFENLLVSGTYTPTGGTGDRIAVELELSFNNRFDNMSVGYPGAPIGSDKSFGLWMGIDNVNANRFYGYRGVGNFAVAETYGVRVQGTSNCFFGGDISAIHTAFQDYAALACHRYGMHHESVSRVVSVGFASRGCIIEPGYVSIVANGTAYDLSGVQTVRYTIRGGNHLFNAVGTTGLNKGTSCYALTYEPGIDTGGYPVTAVTGTDNGSGGVNLLKGHEISAERLTFPDIPVGSTNPTTLDCYLENDAATLGISVGATAQTVGSAVKVTKIGRQVTVTGYVQMAAAVSGAGPVTITGLPYVSSGRAAAALSHQNMSTVGEVSGVVGASTQVVGVYLDGAQMTQAALSATSLFDISITYTATS